MAQFTPATEVDFVVIGSGAAGGIMAKQLSSAGLKVVVLEQGGWGKYGHEQDYTKDEWLNDNPSAADRLMSDPSRQRNTFRRNDKGKGDRRHPHLRLRRRRRHRHVRRQQLAPSAVGVQRSDHGGVDCGHRHGRLADLLRRARALLHAGRVGDGHLRPARQFAVRGADVEGLSGSADAAEGVGRAVQHGGGQARLDGGQRAHRHYFEAVHGPLRVRELRHVLGLRMPRQGQIELGGHDDPGGDQDRQLRSPRRTPTCAKFRRTPAAA